MELGGGEAEALAHLVDKIVQDSQVVRCSSDPATPAKGPVPHWTAISTFPGVATGCLSAQPPFLTARRTDASAGVMGAGRASNTTATSATALASAAGTSSPDDDVDGFDTSSFEPDANEIGSDASDLPPVPPLPAVGAAALAAVCSATSGIDVVAALIATAERSAAHADEAAAVVCWLAQPNVISLLETGGNGGHSFHGQVLRVCEAALASAATHDGLSMLAPHGYRFIGGLYVGGVLGTDVMQVGAGVLLGLRIELFPGDLSGWSAAWRRNVTAFLSLLDVVGSTLPIAVASSIARSGLAVGLTQSELDRAVVGLVGGDTERADVISSCLPTTAESQSVVEGWDEWGPPGLNVPGVPIGRCPLCKKKCFTPRSVTPGNGWQTTAAHMTFECCSGLIAAIGAAGTCPVEHCGMRAATPRMRWQTIAHLDAATDHDHLEFLEAYRTNPILRGSGKKRSVAKVKDPWLVQAQLNAKVLYGLCKGNQAHQAKLLLQGGNVDLLRGGEDGYTSLMTAAEAGHVPIIKLLMNWALKASGGRRTEQDDPTPPDHDLIGLNARNTYGQTALILAAQNNGLQAPVLALIQAGEDLDFTVKANGLTAEESARLVGYTTVATCIQQAAAEWRQVRVDLDALDDAILDENVNAVAVVLKAGNVHKSKWWRARYGRRGYGETPLMLAAARGLLPVVQLLLTGGHQPNVNAANARGQTAIVQAVINGHVHVAEYMLVTCGPTLSAVGLVEATTEAGLHDFAQTTQTLMYSKFRGLIDARTAEPARRLHYAIRAGEVQVASELAETNPDLLERGWPHERSPIPVQVAAIYDQPECIRMLADVTPLVAVVTRISTSGRTALEEAAFWGHTDVSRVLKDVISRRERVAIDDDRGVCDGGPFVQCHLGVLRDQIDAMTMELDRQLAVLEKRFGTHRHDSARDRRTIRSAGSGSVGVVRTMSSEGPGVALHRCTVSGSDEDGDTAVVQRIMSAPAGPSTSHPSGIATEPRFDWDNFEAGWPDECSTDDESECDLPLRTWSVDRLSINQHRISKGRVSNRNTSRSGRFQRVRGKCLHGDALTHADPTSTISGAGAALQRAFLKAHRLVLAEQWAVHANQMHAQEKSLYNYGGSQGGWCAAPKIPIDVQPLHLGRAPVKDFVSARKELGGRGLLRAAWHGTKVVNVPSIAAHGLVIPGSRAPGKPYVRVVHGQAHGRGVYTAKNPGLAHGYARHQNPLTEDILLCAVLDDAGDKEGEKVVKHVGDAMVVAKESHVLPLFKVSFGHQDEYRVPTEEVDVVLRQSMAKTKTARNRAAVAKRRDIERASGRIVPSMKMGITEDDDCMWNPVVSNAALKQNAKHRKVRAKQVKRVDRAKVAAREVKRVATEHRAATDVTAAGRSSQSAADWRREHHVQQLLKQGLSGVGGGSRRGAANTEALLLKKLKRKQQGGRNHRSKSKPPV